MSNVEETKFLSPAEVPQIASQFGTPVFVYDLETIKKNYDYFSSIPNKYGMTVRFSVKSNPNRTILQLFDRLGAHFDVSSTYEAHRCINAGIDASKILLTGQEASSDWSQLCEQGMLFDAGSLSQLRAYGEKFPGSKVTVRINPGFGSGLVKKLTTGGDHSSFGIWVEQIEELQQIAAQYNLVVERLHIHIGSGHDSNVLEKTVQKSLELCGQLKDVHTLNFGGGYKVTALKTDPVYDHHAVGERISQAIETFANDTGREIKLELEPGTFLVALGGSLVTSVIDSVATHQDSQFLKVDGGLTELMRPSYYAVQHPLVTVKADGTLNTSEQDYIVSGHCCIAGDTFTPMPGDSEDTKSVTLNTAEVGDYLIVERCGGYAASMCVKNFNSYPESPEVLRTAEGEYQVLRERQDIAHMTQNEIDLSDTLNSFIK